MHVLLTGASGFLGSVCRDLLDQRPDIQVSFLRSGHGPELSATGFSSVEAPLSLSAEELVLPSAITHIIHIGALSSPEMCERDPKQAQQSNVKFTQMVADYAFRNGAHLTTVSTDLVFDGTRAPPNGLTEEDLPHPLSVYAQSKLAAERATLALPSNTVIRIALLYGHSSSQSRGVLGWIEGALKQGTPLTLFFDEYRTPIHVVDAARAIIALSEQSLPGTWHCGGPDRLSRVEFGTLVAEALGYDPSLIRSTSRCASASGPARPEDVSLNSNKLWRTMGYEPRTVKESLASHTREGRGAR
ncbi:MAG: dTDP-4-dehydrorhamnose reductase [Pseudomonadota bacterium]|jgi:dTDP-4-dehydrorhamnose reductase